MRRLLALAALSCCLPGVSRGTEIADRYPLETGFRKLCTGIPVLVSVLDDKDQPVKSAEVIAFSEDWGVRLPVTGGPFAYTDQEGVARLTLFRGRWWVFAGFGRTFYTLRPGEGGFLGKRLVIDADAATIVLKPTASLDISLPADAHEVFAMEQGCSPLVAMPFCGASSRRRLRLHSTDGLQQQLLFVRHPGDDPGFLLTSPPVASGESLQMSLRDDELGRMAFDIQDNNDPGGVMVVGIGYPTADVDQGWQITHFPVRGAQEVFVSPGIVDYYLVYFGADGSGYWFNRRSESIARGQRVEVRGGGPLQVRVLASAGAESQYAINLLLDASDSFGNTLDFYHLADGAVPVVKIRLLDETSAPTYATDWQHTSDWLHLRIPPPAAPLESLRYDVDWDLGMFGRSTLSGPLFTPETAYGFEQRVSDYFDGYFPFGFGQHAGQVLERLEAAYSFMAECTGYAPSYRMNVYVPSDPAGAGQASGNSIWIWMDGFLWWNPDDPVNNWDAFLLHELGHQMEAFSYYDGVPIGGTRNEALASVLAADALDSLGDANKAQLYRRGECQWFLQHVEGTFPDTSPDYELLINRFLLHLYLPGAFGHGIHSAFFQDWINARRVLLDFSEEDAFVTIYSFVCEKNLADAFQAIGYATAAERVYEGLSRLEEGLPDGGYVTTSDPGTDHLVAHYRLDDDAQDSSGNTNNGTLVGSPTWISGGKIGGALQWQGLDYVECGDGPSLHLTDAVTISAWMRLGGPAPAQYIAGSQDGVAGGYKLGVFDNKVEFEIRTSENWAAINRSVAGGTVLTPGVWYHVAGVYSKGSYVATYVNGTLDRILTTSAILGNTTGTFKIGRDPACYGYFWSGAIDDLRVYNKALSPAEIAYLADETPDDGKLPVPDQDSE